MDFHHGNTSPGLPRMLRRKYLLSMDGQPQLYWMNLAGYQRFHGWEGIPGTWPGSGCQPSVSLFSEHQPVSTLWDLSWFISPFDGRPDFFFPCPSRVGTGSRTWLEQSPFSDVRLQGDGWLSKPCIYKHTFECHPLQCPTLHAICPHTSLWSTGTEHSLSVSGRVSEARSRGWAMMQERTSRGLMQCGISHGCLESEPGLVWVSVRDRAFWRPWAVVH